MVPDDVARGASRSRQTRSFRASAIAPNKEHPMRPLAYSPLTLVFVTTLIFVATLVIGAPAQPSAGCFVSPDKSQELSLQIAPGEKRAIDTACKQRSPSRGSMPPGPPRSWMWSTIRSSCRRIMLSLSATRCSTSAAIRMRFPAWSTGTLISTGWARPWRRSTSTGLRVPRPAWSGSSRPLPRFPTAGSRVAAGTRTSGQSQG